MRVGNGSHGARQSLAAMASVSLVASTVWVVACQSRTPEVPPTHSKTVPPVGGPTLPQLPGSVTVGISTASLSERPIGPKPTAPTTFVGGPTTTGTPSITTTPVSTAVTGPRPTP
jgi:hypothetical protein